jgi:hypothetical protein
VSLVCGTKCHPTSVLLASAVLLCPSGEVYTGRCLSKSVEKEPIGIPRLRWEDNSKMHLQEVGFEYMDSVASTSPTTRALLVAKGGTVGENGFQ